MDTGIIIPKADPLELLPLAVCGHGPPVLGWWMGMEEEEEEELPVAAHTNSVICVVLLQTGGVKEHAPGPEPGKQLGILGKS